MMSLIKAGDQLAKHRLEMSCLHAQQMQIDDFLLLRIWVTLARSSSFTCPEHIGCTISSKPSRVHASGLMKDKGHILLSQPHVEGNRGQDSEMLYMHFLLWANL